MNLAFALPAQFHLSEHSSEYFLYLFFIKYPSNLGMGGYYMIPALVMGGLSLAGGLIGSKSSKKPKKKQTPLPRETLNFNKQL